MQMKIYTNLMKILVMLYLIFNYKKIGIVDIDLKNINLDNNFDEDDSDTITLVRLLAGHIKFKNTNNLISQELMSAAWHSNRWFNSG